MLELTIAVFILSSLVIYALTGGADFGGGMWDLLASGPRAARQRKVIAEAIGPIWEANHVWLILMIVLLFTGFPRGFAAMMTALNIPLTAMLVGVVLRGSAFVFRKYDSRKDAVQHRWSTLFGAASFFTPFVQGAVLGALATGRIRVDDGRVITGFFSGWLTPFALLCGLSALALFAFLAATYLTLECQGERDLQDDFRRRALWSGAASGPAVLLVLLAAKTGAPEMFHALTRWRATLLIGGAGLSAVTALTALWFRRFGAARVAAIGQVTLVLVGWGVAQYPDLVTPDVTTFNSAAPAATLRLLVLALVVGAIVLLPSLFFLFQVFKGHKQAQVPGP